MAAAAFDVAARLYQPQTMQSPRRRPSPPTPTNLEPRLEGRRKHALHIDDSGGRIVAAIRIADDPAETLRRSLDPAVRVFPGHSNAVAHRQTPVPKTWLLPSSE